MRVTDKYVFFWQDYFSNWAHVEGGLDIKIKGEVVNVPTSEHIFMIYKAQYFKDDEAVQKIIECKTPKEAKAVGRAVKNFVAEQWDRVCSHYMTKAVSLRYHQDSKFANMLTDKKYEGKTFVEASPYDKIWGIGMGEKDPDVEDKREIIVGKNGRIVEDKSKWEGQNKLGKCLTNLRNRALAGNVKSSNESLEPNGVSIFHTMWK